jgi:hypothetical protein
MMMMMIDRSLYYNVITISYIKMIDERFINF